MSSIHLLKQLRHERFTAVLHAADRAFRRERAARFGKADDL